MGRMSVVPGALIGFLLVFSQPARAADGDFAAGAVAHVPAEWGTHWRAIATGDGYLVLLLQEGELWTAHLRSNGTLVDSEPRRAVSFGSDVSFVQAAARRGQVLVVWANNAASPEKGNVVKAALLGSDGRLLAGPRVLQTCPYYCHSLLAAGNPDVWAVTWSEYHSVDFKEGGSFGAVFRELDEANPTLFVPADPEEPVCRPDVLAGNPEGFLLGLVFEGPCGAYILEVDGTVRTVGKGGFSSYSMRGQPVWTGSGYAYPADLDDRPSVVFIDSHASTIVLRRVMSSHGEGSALTFDGRYVVAAVTTFWGHVNLAIFRADGTPLHPQTHRGAVIAISSHRGWTEQPQLVSNGEGDVLLAFQRREGTIELHIPLRGDGVPDDADNCVAIPNPEQTDVDADGVGDECDDDDGDYFPEPFDNCPGVANAEQADRDLDGEGDVCDPDFDYDGDGWFTLEDNCPWSPNPDQHDFDLDGGGDVCDPDDDADGIDDYPDDNCLWVANADQADSDADGVGDACTPSPVDPGNVIDPPLRRFENPGKPRESGCSIASVASSQRVMSIAVLWSFAAAVWALRRARNDP